MAWESRSRRAERASRILETLDRALPEARIQLAFETPIQLLVSVILSAQCTDARVNQVTPALFARYPDVAALARADVREVEALVRTCGLFRAKAKAIVEASRAIVAHHGGRVPSSREALEALPGVGRKTAGVVAMTLGGDRALPVDTHVRRLAQRMGLSRSAIPDRVEEDLRALVPPEQWSKAHHLLIWHGRRTCTARAPACDRCPVAALCPKRGVARAKRPRTSLRSALRRAKAAKAALRPARRVRP